jgi:hypothetical protein
MPSSGALRLAARLLVACPILDAAHAQHAAHALQLIGDIRLRRQRGSGSESSGAAGLTTTFGGRAGGLGDLTG